MQIENQKIFYSIIYNELIINALPKTKNIKFCHLSIP